MPDVLIALSVRSAPNRRNVAERTERADRRKQAEAPTSEEAADVMAAVNALDSIDEAPKRRRRRDADAATDLLAELGLDDASPKQDDRRRHRKDDASDVEPRRRRRAVEGPKDEDVCAILMTFSPRCLRRAVMMTNVVTRLKTVISRVVVAVASAIGVTAWIVVAVAAWP